MDLIERQAAIDAVHAEFDECLVWDESGQYTADEVERILTDLPSAQPEVLAHGEGELSAQPEIIRCKDCKYSDENWRRVSVKWLPCMDMRTGSNWYCADAERRTDE